MVSRPRERPGLDAHHLEGWLATLVGAGAFLLADLALLAHFGAFRR